MPALEAGDYDALHDLRARRLGMVGTLMVIEPDGEIAAGGDGASGASGDDGIVTPG